MATEAPLAPRPPQLTLDEILNSKVNYAVEDDPLEVWDKGVFLNELLRQGIVLNTDKTGALDGKLVARKGLETGTYMGTRLALTELYKILEEAAASHFDTQGFEPIFPVKRDLALKQNTYQWSNPSDCYPPHLNTLPQDEQQSLDGAPRKDQHHFHPTPVIMTDAEKLELPKGAPVEDPGAHELAEESESDDQFTDAASGAGSPKISSPIPKTRVEKVDDQPSHGEVPGTEAYEMRGQDAQPDEIAIAPETGASQNAPSTPEIKAPTTIVEEAPGARSRSHSIQYEERRKADASPDILVDSDGQVKEIQGESAHVDSNSDNSRPSPDTTDSKLQEDGPSESPRAIAASLQDADDDDDDTQQDNDGDDGFGDDFDDFEEGNEDDDFDDFEDGFQEAETPAPTATQPPQQSTLPFSIPDFDGLDPEAVVSALEPFLATLYPPEELDLPTFPPLSKDSVFFTARSASLWSQLVAPPPLAPPDWIRSRTRRLFLVSLGVPVDLDEILPASKQKKLVLPSLNVPSLSPRTSTDSRSVSRLRQGEGNNSSTSVDTQGKPSASTRKRRGPPPQPELDLVAARHLCQTTDEALDGMTDEELKAHVAKLEGLQEAAKEALEYWKKRTDEKIGDREAFEGVIENLVKHARKTRK